MKVKKKNPLKHRRLALGLPPDKYKDLKDGKEVEVDDDVAIKLGFLKPKTSKKKPVKKEE